MSNSAWHLVEASQTLLFLSVVGFIAAIVRLRVTAYRWHMLAFALLMLGFIIREAAVSLYGPGNWNDVAFTLSAVARDIKIIGALVFIRAISHERYGEYLWLGCLAVSLAFAAFYP